MYGLRANINGEWADLVQIAGCGRILMRRRGADGHVREWWTKPGAWGWVVVTLTHGQTYSSIEQAVSVMKNLKDAGKKEPRTE